MKLCLRCNQQFEDTLDKCPKDQGDLEPIGKDPIIGSLIDDRYVIDSVIGKGSSGIVYKASRLMMGGDVAVKVIHSYLGADSASLDRLLRELKAAERLRHAHVITVWDSGTTDDGQPYLVMDYCEGITLSQLITQKGALPPKRVLNVVRQVTEALGHAHEQGFIHRDMKPENIVLEESELRGDYVKVLDFGIADTPHDSAQRAKFNKPKTVAGSPAYMSPEQCQGFELDYRSDLYSLAVIVFEMFTGRRPFLAHDLMKLMYMTVTEQPPKMGQVRKDLSFPDKVEAIVSKALSKLPDDRQPTIRDFWRDLEQACEGLDFGKSDRVKLAPPREQQNFADLEILPNERLIDEEKPKKPQFELGPEDMPELYMPPPPPPKGGAPDATPASGSEPRSSAPPPPPAGGPPRPPGVANLVNRQQQAGKPPTPPAAPPPSPSVSGTVKPLQPTRIGPAGAKLPAGAPPKPNDASQPRPQAPAPARPPGPPGPPGGASGVKGPPAGPPKAPPPPGGPGTRPGGGPPPPPTVAPPLPVKPPPAPSNDDIVNSSNGPGGMMSDVYSQFPDKTMSRLSALVKRPTSTVIPNSNGLPPAETVAPAKPAAPEPAPERPPSVYSYVPPKEEKPAEPEANNQIAKPTVPVKLGGPGPGGQVRPGGPGGPGPGGSARPSGSAGQAGPGGLKPGGPIQARTGAPTGSKPGAAGPNPGGPGGQKSVQNRPAGSPGAPSGAKPGESPSGNRPAGSAPVGNKVGPGGGQIATRPPGSAPGSEPAKPAQPTPSKPAGDKPEPSKSGDESKNNEPGKSNEPGVHHDELTPALARAGATWVESSTEWNSLDGNLLDESKQSAQRRISNLDWEDEIEALKTGSVDPIVIDPGHGGELLNPNNLNPSNPQPGTPWPPGMVPPGGQPSSNQLPGQMPPQGMPGYPPMQQGWPPGMMPGQQPMMPGYDQTKSYPPGMMHPYMQPPGYPPGYPLPPNQDVSGAYPMMPNYPPPNQDVSGGYQLPGYMPPGQGYPYGPGMPMMMPGMPGMPPQGMPGMPPQGMPPQGMPPGMVPQGMPGMMPQGMPPGMVPQGMPPGMVPQGVPPFMNPVTPDAVSGAQGGLGSALMEDLKSEFGETPQGDSLEKLLEEAPADNEAPPTLPTLDQKPDFASAEPETHGNDLAVPLDKFEKFEDTDEGLKQKELAAKSAAEAAELGDSLLALMDSTEKDRGGSLGFEKPATKSEGSKKNDESPKSTGSRALGSLLGALAASADDDIVSEPADGGETPMAGGNAFADAVASSASVPSLTEKSKKSGSAFGQLLAAVKEDDQQEEPPSSPDFSDDDVGGHTLPKQAISDALDDLLGPDDPNASVHRAPAMRNPFEADDNVLGDGNAIVQAKPNDTPTAAARLAAVLTDDDEPEPPYGGVDAGSITSGAMVQNPSTSTSDALSRLLEAASKAPSKASESTSGPAMSEIDKMAARVNKPPAKVSRKLASAKASGNEPSEPQPFSGFGPGGGGSAFGAGNSNYGGDQAIAYGGAPDIRSSGVTSTGANSSYSQEAVNARIAELQRKLEQQSIGKDVELPQAPPPEPSVIGEVNRRDVVNRIMEEAGKRHQYGADYEAPEPAAASMKPSTSGTNFGPNELEKVNSSRLASMAEQEQRRKKSRVRTASMPRIPVVPIAIGVVVVGLGAAAFFNQEALKHAWEGMMPAEKPAEKKDAELMTRVNDFVKSGKLNEARKILEQEEDKSGLPVELSEKLDTIYIGIARYKKNAGQFTEAIDTLKLIQSESSHYADAQKYIKSLQKGGKKTSTKRKRR